MKHLRSSALLLIGLQFVCTVYSRSYPAVPCPKNSGICIQQICDPNQLSEGPHWDTHNWVLYFVDIPKQKLFCWDPETGNTTSAYIKNGQLGVVVPVDGMENTFVGGAGTDFVQITWDRKTNSSNPDVKVLATVDNDRKGTRFNDGKVDPNGRFWAGTMGINSEPELGSLYKIGSDNVPKRMVSPVTISNGLTWSHDNKTFYYIDSPTYKVSAYDYDNDAGEISNGRTVFDFKTNNVPGIPDGMTIDKDGNLWIACYDGGRVISVDPKTGKLLRSIEMPAHQVTSVEFGGRNLDVLFVTTARQDLNSEDLKSQPTAGAVFQIVGLETFGSPSLRYKL